MGVWPPDSECCPHSGHTAPSGSLLSGCFLACPSQLQVAPEEGGGEGGEGGKRGGGEGGRGREGEEGGRKREGGRGKREGKGRGGREGRRTGGERVGGGIQIKDITVKPTS